MMSKLVLSTRGALQDEDYRWFSNERVLKWWSPYEQLGWIRTASPNLPCLALRSDGTRWNLLIGSVPSIRVDRGMGIGRAIGLHLTLSGDAMDLDVPLSFIEVWLEDLAQAQRDEDKLMVGRGRLSRAVDEIFSEHFIERWFSEGDQPASNPYKAWDERADELIEKVVRNTESWKGNGSAHSAEAVMTGEILSAEDRLLFLDKVRETLLARQPGIAVYANPIKPGGSTREVEGLPLLAVLHNPPGIRILRTRPDPGPARAALEPSTISDHEARPPNKQPTPMALEEFRAEHRETIAKLEHVARAGRNNRRLLIAILILAVLLAIIFRRTP